MKNKKIISAILGTILVLSGCEYTMLESTSEITDSISVSTSVSTSNSESTSESSSEITSETSSEIISESTSEPTSTPTQVNLSALVEIIINTVPSDVYADLDLFSEHVDFPTCSILWTSSAPEVIDDNGKYYQPIQDTFVTLSYSIIIERKVMLSDTLEVVAKGEYVSVQAIDDWLQKYNFDIPSPLYFPTTIRHNVIGFDLAINWTSSNTQVLKIEGDYLMPRSVSEEQAVTLKGEVKVKNLTFTRLINITIPAQDQVLPSHGNKYTGLPIIDIDVNPTSKEYINGNFSMTRSQAYVTSYEVPTLPMQIRVRGNNTSQYGKKPFRIKFEKKQSLLGMGAAKNWVLLADYMDETHLREATPKMLGNQLDGMAFNTRYFHVEVYLNGKYNGLYLLTDQIQIQETRINIYENDDEIDTGYLFEWDWKTDDEDVKGVNYFDAPSIGKVFQMKAPEALSTAQSEFLLDYINSTANLIKANKTSVEPYREFFDLNAAYDYIIVNEIFSNQDIWGLSGFMYKDKGGPLTFGPVWDFHLSAGNCRGDGHPGIANSWHTVLKDQNQWFYYLMRNTAFRELFQARWNQIIDQQIKDMMIWIRGRQDLIRQAAEKSIARWGKNSEKSDEVIRLGLTTFDDFVNYFYDWVNAKIYFMNAQINDPTFTLASYSAVFEDRHTSDYVNARRKDLSELNKYF